MMRTTSSQRGIPQFSSLPASWLFWITFCFGAFLLIYAPRQFFREATEQVSAANGLTLSALCFYGLSGLAVFLGLRWCVLTILSYAAISRIAGGAADDASGSGDFLPFVSILVPAYCEADCIQEAMRALVRLDYPAYEVIVVDDGSPDDTYKLALPFAGDHYSRHGQCHVRVFTKGNGGKSSAHNFALRHARAGLVLCIDADSRIEAGALRLMVRRMRDPRVAAVAGQIRVRNRRSLLCLSQAFEYMLASGAFRFSQAATGSVMIVPGPLGLFRRDALDRAAKVNAREGHFGSSAVPGPFSPLTFAEDFHLSLLLLSLGYRIDYEPYAIAHTKAPTMLSSLISQRYRWFRGTMQVLLWYLGRTLRGEKSPLHIKAWLVSSFFIDLFCFPIIYFALFAGLVMYFIRGGDLPMLGTWIAASWIINFLCGSLYAVAQRDRVSLSFLSPVFDFYQGVVLNCAWLIAVFDQARGARMRW